MVYMKGQVENSECGMNECISEHASGLIEKVWSKFWRMVRYPWGVAKLYSIGKDLVE